MYPGVLAVSMRKYVYAVLLLVHTVPLPPPRATWGTDRSTEIP